MKGNVSMNKLISFLSIFFLFFIVATFADTPQLQAQGSLVAQCLQAVSQGGCSLYGSGIASDSSVQSQGNFTKSPDDFDCRELLRTISQRRFDGKVICPEDDINFSVWLADAQGHILFVGCRKFKMDKWYDGSWHVPENSGWVELEMVGIPELKVDSPETANGAFIYVRDGNGTITISQGLPLNSGYLSIPQEYAGQKGQFVVSHYQNGRYWQQWYDLATMKEINPIMIAQCFLTQVSNYYDWWTDPVAVKHYSAVSSDGTWVSPLDRVRVINSLDIPVSCLLWDGKAYTIQADAVVFWKMGDVENQTTQPLDPVNPIMHLPAAGVYQFRFVHEGLPESKPQYIDFWSQYNGKG